MLPSFFSRLFSRPTTRKVRSPLRKPRRLWFEQLEDRITPSNMGTLHLTNGNASSSAGFARNGSGPVLSETMP